MKTLILKTLIITLSITLGGALAACNPTTESAVSQISYSGPFANIDAGIRKELQTCGVGQTEFERLLGLSQKDFDQDFEGGWRSIGYKENCNNAAAEMIKSYILYSEPNPPERIGILRWHAGQTKASAGKYAEAISLFKGTYQAEDDHELAWNFYVDATIAFLKNDRRALQLAHDNLAQLTVSEEEKASRRKFLKDNPKITMPEGFVDNPQNLSPVKSLLNCFGKSYKEAYGRCEVD